MNILFCGVKLLVTTLGPVGEIVVDDETEDEASERMTANG